MEYIKDFAEITAISAGGATVNAIFHPKENFKKTVSSGVASTVFAMMVGYVLHETSLPNYVVHGICGVSGMAASQLVAVIVERSVKWAKKVKLPNEPPK